MTSTMLAAKIGCNVCGTAATVSPAPARKVARAQSTPAPVIPGDPAMTSTAPAPYLSEVTGLGGTTPE